MSPRANEGATQHMNDACLDHRRERELGGKKTGRCPLGARNPEQGTSPLLVVAGGLEEDQPSRKSRRGGVEGGGKRTS